MLRRRSLMDMQAPAQDWDVAWDYTMGLPEDNGFEKYVSGNNILVLLENDGLHIAVSFFDNYVRYQPTDFETCNEGIYEETIVYNAFGASNGNRIMLSDGNRGLQIYIYNNSIMFNSEGGQILVTNALVLSKEYTIRIERLNGINRIYLDGDKIYETEVVSRSYVQGNRIFFQDKGDYLLKSMKFKKVS